MLQVFMVHLPSKTELSVISSVFCGIAMILEGFFFIGIKRKNNSHNIFSYGLGLMGVNFLALGLVYYFNSYSFNESFVFKLSFFHTIIGVTCIYSGHEKGGLLYWIKAGFAGFALFFVAASFLL